MMPSRCRYIAAAAAIPTMQPLLKARPTNELLSKARVLTPAQRRTALALQSRASKRTHFCPDRRTVNRNIEKSGHRILRDEIQLNFITQRFSGSLITNLLSNFQNSKWRIQNGGTKCKKLFDRNKIEFLKIFGVADYESALRFSKK